MKQGMIAIWEEASQLRKLMPQQSDRGLRTRLHLLYVLRTGVATNRAHAAPRLGIGRNTVGQWLHQYECGGLATLLTLGHAPGRASSVPAEVIAGMRAKLAEPTGCASFHELWRFGRTDLSSAHDLLRDLVHRHPRLGRAARRRTPHAHQKSPMPKRVFAPHSPTASVRRRCRPPRSSGRANYSPSNNYSRCRSLCSPCGSGHRTRGRFGLITIQRRRLTLRGIKPIQPSQHELEWSYLYGCVEPLTGENFFLALPAQR